MWHLTRSEMLISSELSSMTEFRGLRAEWCDLLRRCPWSTPFQHPGWLLPWFDRFGSGDLCVITIRDSGYLTGLLPLFVHEWENRRQVTIIGTGITDYLDILADPDTDD